MAQKSQSDIAVICPAMERSHDDHYAMDLANVILGRIGLMGRLGKNIREKQGLAYYAMSTYSPRITGGYWMAFAGVNPANVDRAISSIFQEMDRISEKHITKREYSDVMTNRAGSMALRLETCSGVAGFMHTIERHQLGLDYADRFEGIIRSVTFEDITRVCAENLKTDEAISAIAGPKIG
jgi:zinc protease